MAVKTRAERHARASRRYWGTDYDHLKPWADRDTKLYEKKPSRIMRLEKMAVDNINGYLFGKGKGPRFTVEAATLDPEAASVDQLAAASTDAAARVAALHVESGLDELQSEIGRLGILHGTVAVGFHYDQVTGRFDCEVLAAGMSKVTLGRDNRKLARELGIAYDDVLMLDERWSTRTVDEDGEPVELLHRRLWEPTKTTEYKPIPIADGDEPPDDEAFQVDGETTVEHNLGFVPVEWIANGAFVANDVEGVPLMTDAEFEVIDGINYTISQTDRGVTYNQEPTVVFLNVANVDATDAIAKGAGRTLKANADPNSAQAPDVKLLELAGAGQTLAIAFAHELRTYLFHTIGVVIHDPDSFGGALSGTALERLLMPTLQVVTSLRPGYGKRLARLLAKMLRAEQKGAAGLISSPLPPVVAKWGRLIEPTIGDALQAVAAATQALDAGFIDESVAIRYVAPYFGVEDVDALIARMLAGGTVTPVT